MSIDEQPPEECYTRNPSSYAIRCRRCRWQWACIALFIYRRRGIFAIDPQREKKGSNLSSPVGVTSMFVEPNVLEWDDWGTKPSKFTHLSNSIEEIEWDIIEALGNFTYLERHKLSEDYKCSYPICIWCEYLKTCNGSLFAFLKAKKILCCNIYQRRSTIEVTDPAQLKEVMENNE